MNEPEPQNIIIQNKICALQQKHTIYVYRMNEKDINHRKYGSNNLQIVFSQAIMTDGYSPINFFYIVFDNFPRRKK